MRTFVLGCGDGTRTTRPSVYETDELPSALPRRISKSSLGTCSGQFRKERKIIHHSLDAEYFTNLSADEFDTEEGAYKQLIVWNPEAEEIIGGYRYLMGTEAKMDKDGQPILATAQMSRS